MWKWNVQINIQSSPKKNQTNSCKLLAQTELVLCGDPLCLFRNATSDEPFWRRRTSGGIPIQPVSDSWSENWHVDVLIIGIQRAAVWWNICIPHLKGRVDEGVGFNVTHKTHCGLKVVNFHIFCCWRETATRQGCKVWSNWCLIYWMFVFISKMIFCTISWSREKRNATSHGTKHYTNYLVLIIMFFCTGKSNLSICGVIHCRFRRAVLIIWRIDKQTKSYA